MYPILAQEFCFFAAGGKGYRASFVCARNWRFCATLHHKHPVERWQHDSEEPDHFRFFADTSGWRWGFLRLRSFPGLTENLKHLE
ncbi:hypothetical protein ACXR0O_23245 [Verrucomicrobiota bacterium sgz303538]